MRRNKKFWLEALTIGGLLVASCSLAAAQGSQGSQSGQGGQSQPPAQSSDKPKPPASANKDIGHEKSGEIYRHKRMQKCRRHQPQSRMLHVTIDAGRQGEERERC